MDGLNRRFSAFAIWMLAHFLAYIAVAVSIRYLSYYFSIVAIAAIRWAGSLGIAGAFVFRNEHTRLQLAGLRPRDHIQRSLIHLLGSLALIWSVANLQLGFIATVEFSGPLFAALIGIVVASQIPGAVAGVGLSFIAIGSAYLLLLQGLSQDARLLIPVGAVALLTVTNLMLARLAETKSVTLIVFIMHSVQLPIYLGILLINPDFMRISNTASSADSVEFYIFLAALILIAAGFVTQIALANASRFGTTLQLCAADTLRVPFLTIVGYMVFGEILDSALLLPGLLVVSGAVIASLPRQLSADQRA